MRAALALANGRIFEGEGFGARTTVVGEVVFNTSLTGYQEVLTDPSYRGQMVCMTVPHVGNTGVNREDVESDRPQVTAFIVRPRSARLCPTGAPTKTWGAILNGITYPALARWIHAR